MAFFPIPQPDAMDELAKKMNQTFITQLNASSVDSENTPKLFAADLTYARMLQRKRLQAKGITFQATHTPDDPPVSGVS